MKLSYLEVNGPKFPLLKQVDYAPLNFAHKSKSFFFNLNQWVHELERFFGFTGIRILSFNLLTFIVSIMRICNHDSSIYKNSIDEFNSKPLGSLLFG